MDSSARVGGEGDPYERGNAAGGGAVLVDGLNRFAILRVGSLGVGLGGALSRFLQQDYDAVLRPGP